MGSYISFQKYLDLQFDILTAPMLRENKLQGVKTSGNWVKFPSA